MAIKKIPKNRHFANASLHSFCFFAVASIASFMFKFCLYLIIYAAEGLYFFFARGQANFSEIYVVKVRVLASKQINLKKNRSNLAENKRI